MGDTVMLTAALEQLHRRFPNAQIHAAVTDPWIALLEGFPGVTKLWPVTWHADKAARTKAATRLAFQLRKEKYDIVCSFHSSPAAAMVALSTGAKVRSVHFHSFKAKNMYSTVEIPPKVKVKPVIERDLDTVRALGVKIPEGAMPKIYLRDQEKIEAETELHSWSLKGPILGIALGASRPTKRWPMERFGKIATQWIQETNGSVLVICGPGEENLFEDFYKTVSDSESAKQKIQNMPPCNVRKLAARISVLDVLVGNDSGPRHLATAVGVPTVTLFGPEHPLEWHPYPENKHPRFFVEPLPCRSNSEPNSPPWCGLFECVVEDHKCMKQIDEACVFSELQRLFRDYPKAARTSL